MYHKNQTQTQSVVAPRTSGNRPNTEIYETEFEEDLSDYEEYSGRRSEDSVGHAL